MAYAHGFSNGFDCHETREYKRGLRQLAKWHETCRRRRLGMFEAQEKMNKRIYDAKLERDRNRSR